MDDIIMLQLENSNYGDAVAHYMNETLFNVKIYGVRHLPNKQNYVTMGSICFLVNPYSVVWGAGYGSLPNPATIVRPKLVKCVRGPLTRNIMLMNSIECPPVYGDPALLLPLVHNYPTAKPKYKYGFIPHYVDKNHSLSQSVKNSTDFLFIDIESGHTPEYLLESISQCENIISSSLHGLVIAVAYKKPCIWIKLSEQINGGILKYRDFFYSLNYICDYSRLNLSNINNFTELSSNDLEKYKIIIDKTQLEARGIDLLKSSPFVSDDSFRLELLKRWKEYIDLD